MARGFLAGAVHGGLLSAFALAALSLWAPLPERPAAPEAEPAAAPASPAPATPEATSAPVPEQETARPDALPLPTGSEFGRGGDVAPRLPGQGPARPRAEQAAPLAAPVSGEGRVPAVVTNDNARPEAPSSDSPQAPRPPAGTEGEAAPALTLPALTQPAPRATEAPRTAPAALAAPSADAVQDRLPTIAPDSAATPDRAPRLPSPGLDLSLPPDLTDLRRMERN